MPRKPLTQVWRMTPLWGHKLLVLAALVLFFRWGYVEAAGFNKYRPDPLFADIFLDHWIPLAPAFILFYMLGYVFVAAPVFVIDSRRECYLYAGTFFLLLSITLVIFTQLPIAMEKTIATGNDWLSRITRFQQQVDSRYNNLPSLHVSLNFYTYLFIRDKRPRLGHWLAWVVPFVVASTLLVKQHLILDCITGLIAGWLAWRAYRWLRQRLLTARPVASA